MSDLLLLGALLFLGADLYSVGYVLGHAAGRGQR